MSGSAGEGRTVTKTGSGSSGGGRDGSGGARVCPTSNDYFENDGVVGAVVVKPSTTNEEHRRQEPEGEDGDRFSVHTSHSSSEEDWEDSSDTDQTPDGEFSLDMDVVDDVTSDEGFELGEVSWHPGLNTCRRKTGGREGRCALVLGC